MTREQRVLLIRSWETNKTRGYKIRHPSAYVRELMGECCLRIQDNFKVSHIHRPGYLVSPLKLAVRCERSLLAGSAA